MTWSEWPSAARGDGVISIPDCGVTVIQNFLPPGRAFNNLSVFREIVSEIPFVKVTKDDN